MQTRRITCVLMGVMVTLGSSACSKSVSIDPNSDPGPSSEAPNFHFGEPAKISGYTRASDGYRSWKGIVQLSAPDSLHFTPSGASFREPFVIHRSEIVSLDVIVPDKTRTATARTIGAFVAIVGGVVVVYTVTSD